MKEQRKKEIKYLVGTFIAILFGLIGSMLAAATIVPPADVKTDSDYYIVGIVSSLVFFGICFILFKWSKKQLV